ncbi:MAG: hypothetical protein Q3962_08795 [Corynebacterium sp.]|nr:hypothetical protein [Corynebacterium sp.]
MFSFKKSAMSAAAAATILGCGVVVATQANAEPFFPNDPTVGVNLYANPYVDNARIAAQNLVNKLEHLTQQDKAYYTSAIGIATDQAQIDSYVSQAISDNNYNAAHPDHMI